MGTASIYGRRTARINRAVCPKRLAETEAGIIDRDIWITANETIKLHGDEAAIQAAIRADGSQLMGDEQGYATWKRILAAINELTSADPSGPPH